MNWAGCARLSGIEPWIWQRIRENFLGLFRSTYQVCGDDEAYIHKVAQSRDLEEGRRNIFLWRVWVLERTAVLTFNLLKRLCLVEEAVSVFMRQSNISPFRETQTPAFLEAMSGPSQQSGSLRGAVRTRATESEARRLRFLRGPRGITGNPSRS